MMAMTTRHKVHTTHFVGNCAGAQALSTRSFSAIAHRLRTQIDTHTNTEAMRDNMRENVDFI